MKKGIDIIRKMFATEKEIPSMFIKGHVFSISNYLNETNICEFCLMEWDGNNSFWLAGEYFFSFTLQNVPTCKQIRNERMIKEIIQ